MVSTLATDAVLLLLGVTSGCLVARLLQPAGRGALAAVLLWPQLLASAGMVSVNEATTFLIAAEPSHRERTCASALTLVIILALGTVGVGYVALPFLLSGEKGYLAGPSRYYLLALVPAQFLTLASLSISQAGLHFGRFNIVRLCGQLVYVSGLLVLPLWGGCDVYHVVALNGLSVISVALVALAELGPKAWGRPNWEQMKQLLKLSIRFHPLFMLMICGNQLDQLVAISMWDNATVGHYAVAATIAASSLGLISGACNRVFFPYLAQAQLPAVRKELLTDIMRHSMLLAVAVSVPYAISLPFIIPLLFGPDYRTSIVPALFLLLSHQFVTPKTILVQCLRGCGEGKPGTIAAALALLSFGLLAVPLAKCWSMSGMALAVGLSNIIALAYLASYLSRDLGLDFRSMWGLNSQTARQAGSMIREVWIGLVSASRVQGV